MKAFLIKNCEKDEYYKINGLFIQGGKMVKNKEDATKFSRREADKIIKENKELSVEEIVI